MSAIVTYAGCSIGDGSTYTYSSIQGQWQRAAQLWADGSHLYIFWGDVQGQLTFFDMETTGQTAAEALLAVAEYNAPVEFTLYQGVSSATATTVCTIQGCYSFNLAAKKFKQMGDVFIIEGGTEYKIFYTPAAAGASASA